MCYTTFPQIDLPGTVAVPISLHQLRHLLLRERLAKNLFPAPLDAAAIPADARGGSDTVPGPVEAAGAEG
uniref:Uncharacterized protein n=1 Tax=Arundo donax TaxID=35708 RepID=A0A0A9FZL8_ARUDO